MRRVLLTDRLTEVLEVYRNALADHFQTYCCYESEKLIDMIDQISPELMVLDISMPWLDLEALAQALEGRHIPILVVSLFSDHQVEAYAARIGARWVYVKPVQPYALAARMLEYELELDDDPDIRMRTDIYSLMLRLGVRLSYGGFQMLAEGIVYACKHMHFSMTDDLYPYVAKVCGGTASSVEIAMRRSIQQAFKRSASALWQHYIKTSPPDKCPSNSAFIKQLAFAICKAMQIGYLV